MVESGSMARFIPWILGLALATGTPPAPAAAQAFPPPVGDSARLNAAWYVDDVPRYHWQGGGGAD